MTSTDRPERYIRSMLFVPGSRPAMIAKAAASAADAVCLDLEDSVLPDEKAASRGNVVRALRELDFGPRVRIVRINSLDTEYADRDLMDVLEGAADLVDVVMIPKAGSAADVAFVDNVLARIEDARGLTRRIGIEAQIESAAGFLYVREIASASSRLEGLVFGPGDFAASMQMPATAIGELDAHDAAYPGHRYHAVMLTIVAAARANGLRCMDGPYAGYTDTAGLVRACQIAVALGFDGKQCIHPGQLATVNAAFSPSEEEVARASALVKAYESAIAEGRGAASYQGRMIDAASLRMAQVILRRHDVSVQRGS
ncbi:MAG TPA: CoA ester lyase [Vicinamibacterales bacterium]|nr:CoA ester lyase [Vicinamibacterales bacterium]